MAHGAGIDLKQNDYIDYIDYGGRMAHDMRIDSESNDYIDYMAYKLRPAASAASAASARRPAQLVLTIPG